MSGPRSPAGGAYRVGGAISWIAAAFGYLILEAAAAAAVPAYNYANNYISALGVPTRSPLAAAMNAAFCLQGLLFLTGAVLVVRGGSAGRYSRLFVFLAATNTVGNIAVATVHSGSAWASLHGLGALLAIGGGNAAIVAGSSCIAKSVRVQWYRALSVVIAGAGFLGLAMFLLGLSIAASHVGFWERAGVYSILMWQVVTAALLLITLISPKRPKIGDSWCL